MFVKIMVKPPALIIGVNYETNMTVSHGLFNIINYFNVTNKNVITVWP
jgi:hypothetical protein